MYKMYDFTCIISENLVKCSHGVCDAVMIFMEIMAD